MEDPLSLGLRSDVVRIWDDPFREWLVEELLVASDCADIELASDSADVSGVNLPRK